MTKGRRWELGTPLWAKRAHVQNSAFAMNDVLFLTLITALLSEIKTSSSVIGDGVKGIDGCAMFTFQSVETSTRHRQHVSQAFA